MSSLVKRKSPKAPTKGPLMSPDGREYNYIVVVDAGSSGSRVYVYNYLLPLNTEAAANSTNSANSSAKLPEIKTFSTWNRKVRPGISSFGSKPGKVGKKHLKKLIKKALEVVPESQIARTPFFLHATAGMRLLRPGVQAELLSETCQYVRHATDFFLPDCATHVSVIGGETEGIFAWLGLNYAAGALDNPEDHNHGKGHHTYGLLDMGGASAQLVFAPNTTEAEEHQKALFTVQLGFLGPEGVAQREWQLFSTTFLGYGLNQARKRYEKFLAVGDGKDKTDKSPHLSSRDRKKPNLIEISDPCLQPSLSVENSELGVRFVGQGNFTQCAELIRPVLLASINGTQPAGCSADDGDDELSSCLLDPAEVPAMDFDVNRFVGVSNYWEQTKGVLAEEETYDYSVLQQRLAGLCAANWDEIEEQYEDGQRGSVDSAGLRLQEYKKSELENLCFGASWVLSVLHEGLGFPRVGAAASPDSGPYRRPFQGAEEVNGTELSWTLGRAVLYASAEAAGDTTEVGFYHNQSPGQFNYGGEAPGLPSRPAFDPSAAKLGLEDHNDNFESDYRRYFAKKHGADDDGGWAESMPSGHRLYGLLVFCGLFICILWLLMGRARRARVWQSVAQQPWIKRVLPTRWTSKTSYRPVGSAGDDTEAEIEDLELSEVAVGDGSDQFSISDSDSDVEAQRGRS